MAKSFGLGLGAMVGAKPHSLVCNACVVGFLPIVGCMPPRYYATVAAAVFVGGMRAFGAFVV